MMENEDKIFEKIKQASLNPEAEHFPSIDKVWSRVESKLDNKVLKKQNQLWKKIAVAASFLLVFTLSYQIFKPSEPALELPIQKKPADAPLTIQEFALPAKDTQTQLPSPSIQVSQANDKTTKAANAQPAVPSANAIISVADESVVATPAPQSASNEISGAASGYAEKEAIAKEKKISDDQSETDDVFQNRVFDARGVKREQAEAKRSTTPKKPQIYPAEKSVPLVVLDGKAITANTDKQALQQGLSQMDPEAVESIVVLDDPLYIINGHQYTEQELFGPNPTSPYHPLGQQQIESLSILQGDKAIAAYGKKGQKGVVIIATKNQKPAPTRKE